MILNYNKAEFTVSYGLSAQIPPSSTLELAFVGRSNVGKSSALNKLFNRKNLARVSCVPGKTATINFYTVSNIHFVDLPGYGYAKVAKTEKQRWSELIEGYFNQDRNIGVIVSLIDMRHPPSALDLQMMEFLVEREFPFIVLLTKCDKLNKSQTKARLDAIRGELPYGEQLTIIPFSAETGEGVETLKSYLADITEQVNEPEEEEQEYSDDDDDIEQDFEDGFSPDLG